MPVPHKGSPKLNIRAADPHSYEVSIRHESGATTHHRVRVDDSLLAELGLSAAQEPVLVRTALDVLIAHSPPSLPEQFDVTDVRAAVPDFDARVLSRV